ncbi:MAG: ATP synthase F1 subunit delta [Planctomycetota bacterium]|nr:ATP synthase F1 subunit delta [Planctomycetota bacterium]
MSESAVAMRYAKALYELAREGGKTGGVLEDLAGLKAAFDSDLERFAGLMHPRMDTKRKDAILTEHFLVGRDPSVSNLMRLLIKHRRESVLKDFFRVYLEIHEQNEGILRVEVETATRMEPSVAQSVRQQIADVTGKKVVLEARTVPGILGGMRLRVGSHLLDGSTQRRLERIERGLRKVPVES